MRKTRMKASLLAIGTELTVGQILNKNAQWMAAQLKKIGVDADIHLTVPDERHEILKSLKYLEPTSDVIFVTGGLGPTSDDFTREVINEWACPNEELQFDPQSWSHIEKLLTPRGIPLRESQRQQCLFPRGAKVLTNHQGTANGFQMKVRDCEVFVLPGPPREIAAIWQDWIHEWLEKNTSHLDPLVTHSWDTMGLGESEIAHLTEEALKGIDIERGYRVHLPYVEVKLSYARSRQKEMNPAIAKVEKVLEPHTVLRDGEMATEMFFSRLSHRFQNTPQETFVIQDQLTRGFLWTRIKEAALNYLSHQAFVFSNTALCETQLKNALILPSLNETENHIEISLFLNGQEHKILLDSPYKKTALFERKLQYFAEMALIESAKLIGKV